MKTFLKFIIQKMIGWYVAPVAAQSQANQQKLEEFMQTYSSFVSFIQAQQDLYQANLTKQGEWVQKQLAKQEETFSAIAAQEQWVRSRFAEHEKKFSDVAEQEQSAQARFAEQEDKFSHIAEREQWTRDRFAEQEEKFSHIAEREQWTRDRFAEQEEKFSHIAEREQWTRDRFAEQEEKFSHIAEREQWTRDRFAEQEEKFSHIAEREQWTRDRFAEQEKKFSGVAEREEWTRQRFEEIECRIHEGFSISSDGRQSFAQSGEDMIISYILHFLQKPMSEVTYLDLGANHAKELSNTYYFYQMGAKGVLLEANPELIPELEQVRPRDIVLNRAISLSQKEEEIPFYVLNGDGLSTIDYEEAKQACRQNPDLKITATYQIKTIRIQEILETYFPLELTILSIDLEGIEEEILEQIDFETYKPWIIVLENIPYRPILSIDEREYKGRSFLEQRGYTEYAFTGINSIFLRRDVVEHFNQKRMSELQ